MAVTAWGAWVAEWSPAQWASWCAPWPASDGVTYTAADWLGWFQGPAAYTPDEWGEWWQDGGWGVNCESSITCGYEEQDDDWEEME